MATLFTLPQHLRDAIAALADARIVDSGLQAKLDRVLEDADRVEFEDEVELAAEREIVRGANEGSVNGGGRASSKDGEKDKGKEKDEQESTTETETETYPPVPVLRPATIDADILDEIAVWAGRNSERLGAAGLDAAAYGHIALLAGTTVYLPPRARALAKVAERNSDTPNPYLPRHMSPHPPSIGSEYRSVLRMLSTVLNVLFSIFGAGGAAYAAAKSTGWTAHHAILLAVVVGAVVGVADLGLLWIYSRRKRDKAVREAAIRVRENRGSGKEKGSEEKEITLPDDMLALEAEVEKELEKDMGKDDVPTSVIPTKSTTTNIRLRRRALDS